MFLVRQRACLYFSLIRFARVSSHVDDLYTCNKVSTAKLSDKDKDITNSPISLQFDLKLIATEIFSFAFDRLVHI